MKEVKDDLMRNFDLKNKSDISMISVGHIMNNEKDLNHIH